MNTYFSDVMSFFKMHWLNLAMVSIPLSLVHFALTSSLVDLSITETMSDQEFIAAFYSILPVAVMIQVVYEPIITGIILCYVIAAVTSEDRRVAKAISRALMVMPVLLLGYVLIYLATFAGFFLLVVPGLFLYFRLSLFAVSVVAKQLSLVAAFKDSWAVTGLYWRELLVGYIGIFICLVVIQEMLAFLFSSMTDQLIGQLIITIILTLMGLLFEIFKYRIYQLSLISKP